MLITRKSPISGQMNTIDLNITQAQIDAYNSGSLLQNAFPNLPKELREFFKTGITPEEWRQLFD